jgi:hypothetical protein
MGHIYIFIYIYGVVAALVVAALRARQRLLLTAAPAWEQLVVKRLEEHIFIYI